MERAAETMRHHERHSYGSGGVRTLAPKKRNVQGRKKPDETYRDLAERMIRERYEVIAQPLGEMSHAAAGADDLEEAILEEEVAKGTWPMVPRSTGSAAKHLPGRPALKMISGLVVLPSENESQMNHETALPSFSSNFLGATKGSGYMKRVWEQQKQALVPKPVSDTLGPDRLEEEPVCCGLDSTKKCHIAFAALGEGIAHTVSLSPLADAEQSVDPLQLEEAVSVSSENTSHQVSHSPSTAGDEPEECTTEPVHAASMTQYLVSRTAHEDGASATTTAGVVDHDGRETTSTTPTSSNVVVCFQLEESLASLGSSSSEVLAAESSDIADGADEKVKEKDSANRSQHARCRTAYHMFASQGAPEAFQKTKCAESLQSGSLFAEIVKTSLHQPSSETVADICEKNFLTPG
ncbi:unnamed protein product [Amoebophrya sp. A120]|nr:unnamed protein product [Amoebophrya sp. A120]|eukprot:GSA120T00007864001.1